MPVCEVVPHQVEQFAAHGDAFEQRPGQVGEVRRESVDAEAVVEVLGEHVHGAASDPEGVVGVDETGQVDPPVGAGPNKVRSQQRATDGKTQARTKNLFPVVPRRHQLELAVIEDHGVLGRDAGGILGDAAARGVLGGFAARHGQHLEVRAVLEQLFDQQHVVARLVVLVHGRGRERIEEIHRLEDHAAAPAQRLPADADPEALGAVLGGEPIQAVQPLHAICIRSAIAPGQVHEPPGIARWRLIERQSRRAALGVGPQPHRGMVDLQRDRTDARSPHQPKVGIVGQRVRLPGLLPQCVAHRQGAAG